MTETQTTPSVVRADATPVEIDATAGSNGAAPTNAALKECPLHPAPGYVVIQRDRPQEQRTGGGIIVPASEKISPVTAYVCAVGPQALDPNGHPIAHRCKPGDRIITQGQTASEYRKLHDVWEVIPVELVVAVVK